MGCGSAALLAAAKEKEKDVSLAAKRGGRVVGGQTKKNPFLNSYLIIGIKINTDQPGAGEMPLRSPTRAKGSRPPRRSGGGGGGGVSAAPSLDGPVAAAGPGEVVLRPKKKKRWKQALKRLSGGSRL